MIQKQLIVIALALIIGIFSQQPSFSQVFAPLGPNGIDTIVTPLGPQTLIPAGGGGGGGGCTQATTYLAALTSPTPTETSAFTAAICGMVTDGTFASTFFLHILTNTSAANAYVNAITPGTYNLSPSGMCNFNPGGTGTDSGIQGDAMSCSISTGYTPSTGGAMADQFAAGVCILNSRTTSQAWVDMAAFDGSSLIYIDPYDDTFYFRMDVFSASFANVFNPGGTQGSWAVARYGANTSLYQNGAFFGSPSADTFTQITEAPILILAASFGNFSGDTLGYDFAGNLTAGQVTLVYNRLHTMEVALGNSQC